MKTMKRILLPTLLLVVGLMALTACGGSRNVSSDNPLIGQWAWTQASLWTYTFNEDGTGRRGGAGEPFENFEWWTSHGDSRLHLRISNPQPGVAPDQTWDIEWAENNNRITLSTRGAFIADSTFTYTRVIN